MPRFERRGFGRFRESRDFPKPINVGEEYDVEINEVGSRGDGIARIKNFVVFVADTKKGDKAHIRIKEVRNRFAIGEKVAGAEAGEAVEEVAEEAVEAAEPEEEVTEEETGTEEVEEESEEVE